MAYQTKPLPFAQAFKMLLPRRDIMLLRDGDDPHDRKSSAFWQAPNGVYNQALRDDEVGLELSPPEVEALLAKPPYETAVLVGDGAKRYEDAVAPPQAAPEVLEEFRAVEQPVNFQNDMRYIPRQIIPFMVSVGGITSKTVDQKTVDALRSLIETHAQRIHGLTTSFTSSSAARARLSAIMGSQTHVKGAKSVSDQVIFTFAERYGKPVTALLDEVGYEWAKNGITFALMFIEPDPTYTKVVDAWRYEDCEIVHVEGFGHHRDLLQELPAADCIRDDAGKFQSMPQIEATIQGKVLRGRATREAAQLILDAFVLNSFNPHNLSAASMGDVLDKEST